LDRYYTVMIVPERDKGVRSVRLPRVVFRALSFFVFVFVALLSILIFDYWKILKQVHVNKHLTIENRQLKEQIQLNQMKINAVTEDIERIRTFERKLRIITGLKEVDLTTPVPGSELPSDTTEEVQSSVQAKPSTDRLAPFKRVPSTSQQSPLIQLDQFQNEAEYQELKNLYEKKIATTFGLQTGYTYTREWSDLIKQSFTMADQFARFDYTFTFIKDHVENLELDVHELDQYLLDKESFLRSMPTLMPSQGWITSYYGPRISPTSGQLRMHEGLDIGAPPGTAISAPADGIVTFSGSKPGFGNFIQIDHGYGLETLYAHAKGLVAIKGQRITRGDLIATVGSTGYSTGPHLHYEVRVNGTPVDPFYYILD